MHSRRRVILPDDGFRKAKWLFNVIAEVKVPLSLYDFRDFCDDDDDDDDEQETQLSQRDRATLRVITYFAKSLKFTQVKAIRNDTVK